MTSLPERAIGLGTIRFSPAAGTSDAEVARLATLTAKRRAALMIVAHLDAPRLLPVLEEKSRLSPIAVDRSENPLGELFVEQAFLGSCADGGRFNRTNEFGALYLAYEAETAALEVKFHFDRRLAGKASELVIQPVRLQGVEVELSSNSRLLNMREMPPSRHKSMCLTDTTDYTHSQAFANEVVSDGYHGIIYPSVRADGGTCVALFDLRLVEVFRLGPQLLIKQDRTGQLHHAILPR